MDAARTYDIHGQLPRIACPTLVFHGAADPIPLESSERIHAGIAGSRLVVLEDCGHYPFVEAADRFFREIAEFLRAGR